MAHEEKVMFSSTPSPHGDPVPAVIKRDANDPAKFTVYYGGIAHPKGPSHGWVRCSNGVIVKWKLPSREGYVSVEENHLIEPHITGQWCGPFGDTSLE